MENGEAFLSGVLAGTASLADGTTRHGRQPFSDVPVDVSSTSGVCDILFLDVGPIFLDLLCGLVGIFD